MLMLGFVVVPVRTLVVKNNFVGISKISSSGFRAARQRAFDKRAPLCVFRLFIIDVHRNTAESNVSRDCF